MAGRPAARSGALQGEGRALLGRGGRQARSRGRRSSGAGQPASVIARGRAPARTQPAACPPPTPPARAPRSIPGPPARRVPAPTARRARSGTRVRAGPLGGRRQTQQRALGLPRVSGVQEPMTAGAAGWAGGRRSGASGCDSPLGRSSPSSRRPGRHQARAGRRSQRGGSGLPGAAPPLSRPAEGRREGGGPRGVRSGPRPQASPSLGNGYPQLPCGHMHEAPGLRLHSTETPWS